MRDPTNQRHAVMAEIARQNITAMSPRQATVLWANECQFPLACEMRTERDRAAWMYGQEIWDDLYGNPPTLGEMVASFAVRARGAYDIMRAMQLVEDMAARQDGNL